MQRQRHIRRLATVGWIAAGIPILTSAVSAVRQGWVPFGDTAIVAAKVADVLTDDPPLVGGWTSLGKFETEPLHHAGPLAIWLLAVPTRLLGAPGAGMVVGAALIALASLAGIAVLLRRMGRIGTELAVLALVVGMILRLNGERMVEPNAPHVGILPLLLAMVAALGVMAGHHRHLWVLIGAGSLAAQTHLGYAPLIAGLLVLATVAIVIDARADDGERTQLLHRVVPIGVAIGAAAWIGPIVDQLFGSHNITRLLSARAGSDEPTVGWSRALDLTVDAASVPGGWLRRDAIEGMLPDPGWVAVAWAVVMVAVVVAFALWARRESNRYELAVAAVALTMLVVGAASASSVTELDVGGGLLYYRFFWWPVGVMFTLAVVRAVVLAGRSVPAAAVFSEGLDDTRHGMVVAGAVAIVAIGLAPLAHEPPNAARIEVLTPLVDHAAAVERQVGTNIVLHLDDPAAVEQANDGFALLLMAPTMIAELRIAGVDLDFPDEPFDPVGLGPIAAYAFDHAAAESDRPHVWFRVGAAASEPPPAGFELVAFDDGSSGSALPSPSALWVGSG